MLISWHRENSSCVHVGLFHIILNADSILSYPYLWTLPLHHFLGSDTCYWLYKEQQKDLINLTAGSFSCLRRLSTQHFAFQLPQTNGKCISHFSPLFGKLLGGKNISDLEIILFFKKWLKSGIIYWLQDIKLLFKLSRYYANFNQYYCVPSLC